MQGFEAANGLMLRGMTVTVVHFTPWLMARQLDEVSGKMLQGLAGEARPEVDAQVHVARDNALVDVNESP